MLTCWQNNYTLIVRVSYAMLLQESEMLFCSRTQASFLCTFLNLVKYGKIPKPEFLDFGPEFLDFWPEFFSGRPEFLLGWPDFCFDRTWICSFKTVVAPISGKNSNLQMLSFHKEYKVRIWKSRKPEFLVKLTWVLPILTWVLWKTWVFVGPEFWSKRPKKSLTNGIMHYFISTVY